MMLGRTGATELAVPGSRPELGVDLGRGMIRNDPRRFGSIPTAPRILWMLVCGFAFAGTKLAGQFTDAGGVANGLTNTTRQCALNVCDGRVQEVPDR
jgi:hypothetical protein